MRRFYLTSYATIKSKNFMKAQTKSSMEAKFSDIYQHRGWYKGSGSGSLPENTVAYRNLLSNLIIQDDIKTVVDLGCGDWQFSKLLNWGTVKYTGVDVVPSVIEKNSKLYGDKNNVTFVLSDIFDFEIPPGTDLVIIKDVLQHWSNEHIQSFLRSSNNWRYMLATNTIESYDITDPDNPVLLAEEINHDINLGDVRPIDLALPPFSQKAVEILRYASVKRHCPVKDIKSVVLLTNSRS
jgi:SAM-dependent methyltransferase